MGRKSKAAKSEKEVQNKSILRACNSTNPVNDAVSHILVEKRKKKKKNKTNSGNEQHSEVKVLSDEIGEISREAVEINPEQTTDNAVLRKLLRGPRYFDPPENSWGACYNCGEEGHNTVNCTSARRQKPCFVCGGFQHNAKQCSKGRDCFICKQQGHRAKDCPEKNSSKICLKCGDDGHDMFSCRNEYCPDDLMEIKCYVCHGVRHLCCVDYGSPRKTQVSCYRCGGSGHTGLACKRSHHSHGETNGTGTPNSCYKCGVGGHFARDCTYSAKVGDAISSCYKCGEEGHFARECTISKKINHSEHPSFDLDLYTNGSCNKCGEIGHFARECASSSKNVDHFEGPSFDLDQYIDGSCYKCGGEGHFARQCTSTNKAGKRNREHHTTPNQRSSKKNREHIKVRSTKRNLGKAHAYKSHHEEFSSPVMTKYRGGWIPEDTVPEYYNSVLRGDNNWRSPVTSRDKIYNKYNTSGDYYASNYDYHSSRNPHEVNFRNFASHDSHFMRNPCEVNFHNAASHGMSSYYEQRYHPPSRSSQAGVRRDYGRW